MSELRVQVGRVYDARAGGDGARVLARRYRAELDDPAAQEVIEHLRSLARRGNLTLLTGSRMVALGDAVVLAELLGE